MLHCRSTACCLYMASIGTAGRVCRAQGVVTPPSPRRFLPGNLKKKKKKEPRDPVPSPDPQHPGSLENGRHRGEIRSQNYIDQTLERASAITLSIPLMCTIFRE